jgi:ribosomal protein S18 acetylase RimI-like enzyme
VQSKKAISDQIKDGYFYSYIQTNGRSIGYFAYKLDKNRNELFLSKLYILSSERGKGLGKQVINHLEETCKNHKITIFTLTVFHKNQNAISAYEKMGFKNQGTVNRDIGKGIVIIDYKMEKTI